MPVIGLEDLLPATHSTPKKQLKPERISVSSLTSFGATCRRRWRWDQLYYSKKYAHQLFFGRLIHEGLERFDRLVLKDEPPESAAAQVMALVPKMYWDEIDNVKRDWLQVVDLSGNFPTIDFIENILYNYFIYEFENPMPGKVIAVEKSVAIPVPGHSNVLLSGRIDRVLEANDGIWIVDHKTSASAPSLNGLEVDEQTTAYCWLYWKQTGIVPRGVIYNVIIKALPRFPTVLKDGSLSRDKSQSTTHALYLHSLEERGLDRKPYEDILHHLLQTGWSKYFLRQDSDRSLAELESFERRLPRKIADIRLVTKDFDEAYPSPSTYTCSWCPYLGICKSAECGEDYASILEAEYLSYATAPRQPSSTSTTLARDNVVVDDVSPAEVL